MPLIRTLLWKPRHSQWTWVSYWRVTMIQYHNVDTCGWTCTYYCLCLYTHTWDGIFFRCNIVLFLCSLFIPYFFFFPPFVQFISVCFSVFNLPVHYNESYVFHPVLSCLYFPNSFTLTFNSLSMRFSSFCQTVQHVNNYILFIPYFSLLFSPFRSTYNSFSKCFLFTFPS